MSIITLNNRALKDATAVGSTTSLGNLILISRSTASSSSTVDITSGIDSTYKEYIFFFNNMHPSSYSQFAFNGTDDTSSHSFDITKTTTLFMIAHREDGGALQFGYQTGSDLAQGTGNATLSRKIATGNDDATSGEMHLFNPSSTTFVKHFMSRLKANQNISAQYNSDNLGAGYLNTTSAVDAIQFKFASGNIDSGTIKLYGISDS